MMSILNAVSTFLILLSGFAFANVEKTIFIAPKRQIVPDASIDKLLLISLNPQHTTVRKRLEATFPTAEAPQGTDTWMLLEGLSPGTRYELRVCWLATQPTAFRLSTYSMSDVFEDPALLSSLTVFSNSQRKFNDQLSLQQITDRKYETPLAEAKIAPSSLLFLQISAAADYYSLNKTLMQHVPPVFVDVILDRYVFNIFPKSLVPTAGYIVILATGSWFLSTVLWHFLSKIVRPDDSPIKVSRKNQ